MLKRLSLSLSLILVVSPPVAAQGTSANAAGLSGSIFRLMNQVGAPAGGTSPGASAPARVAPVAGPEVLRFKVSPAIRKQVTDSFVAEVTASSPEAGAEWNKLFKGADVFAEMDKQAKTMFGLTTTNLADTWALYWGYAWLMTQGRGDDPTRTQMTALRNQMQGLMLALPDITALSDARKQEMSDTLLLQVVLFSALAEAWKDDPGSFKQFGDGLAEGSRNMGFDLGLLRLTDQGFVLLK